MLTVCPSTLCQEVKPTTPGTILRVGTPISKRSQAPTVYLYIQICYENETKPFASPNGMFTHLLFILLHFLHFISFSQLAFHPLFLPFPNLLFVFQVRLVWPKDGGVLDGVAAGSPLSARYIKDTDWSSFVTTSDGHAEHQRSKTSIEHLHPVGNRCRVCM